MTTKQRNSDQNKNLLSKDEFLAFYYVQMIRKFNMLTPDAARAAGFDTTTHIRAISTYNECYKKYIKEEKIAPPKSFWEEYSRAPFCKAEEALCDSNITKLVRKITWVNTGAPWNTIVPISTFEQVPRDSNQEDYENKDPFPQNPYIW